MATSFTITQENGQRKYCGKRLPNSEYPPKGSEVFIGKIPRDCFEEELIPIFEGIGPLFEFRLMVGFSGFNRGYGFALYFNAEDARRAVNILNNFEIRPGKFIGVVKSMDNCRLFIGKIPRTKTKYEIFQEMSKVTDGIVGVIVKKDFSTGSENRGYAFVEYENHRTTIIARSKLILEEVKLWGKSVIVDWAVPEADVNEDIMAKVKILYVSNLKHKTTELQLMDMFNGLKKGSVERVKKIGTFAFIHFFTREDAQSAMTAKHGCKLDGSRIEITWAKPVTKRRAICDGTTPTHSSNSLIANDGITHCKVCSQVKKESHQNFADYNQMNMPVFTKTSNFPIPGYYSLFN